MSLSHEQLAKVQKLARLRFPEEVQGSLIERLNGVLNWIAQLRQVDVHGVEPMITPITEFIATAPLREDVVTDGDCVKDILSNAPESDHDFFIVPKVVE
jgi:aspartyl-tRNA(Asn)/glutamyl-tRNA(Gln) amidotransferase subunit C